MQSSNCREARGTSRLMREFIDGAEAIARAAVHAGCDFFAGYPITPATSILVHMLRELPKRGGVAIQAEDEIASMGFCIGAAWAGRRVMTATSGPGISLYSESIGLAQMAEVPMVIVDAQRMGPATGGATTVAQGDVQFLRWGTSGGFPLIVLAPSGVPGAYTLTMRAFDLAERFRVPVLLATDKDTVSGKATVDVEALGSGPVQERALAPEGSSFTTFSPEHPGRVSPMAHFGGPHLVRVTTSSHDEKGYQAKWPRQLEALNRHLGAKIEGRLGELEMVRWDPEEGASVLVVCYGVTALAAQEAARLARAARAPLSTLEVQSLWPVPETAIRRAMDGIDRVVVAELNQGQYRREVERVARGKGEVLGVNRMDGELISPSEILEAAGIPKPAGGGA